MNNAMLVRFDDESKAILQKMMENNSGQVCLTMMSNDHAGLQHLKNWLEKNFYVCNAEFRAYEHSDDQIGYHCSCRYCIVNSFEIPKEHSILTLVVNCSDPLAEFAPPIAPPLSEAEIMAASIKKTFNSGTIKVSIALRPGVTKVISDALHLLKASDMMTTACQRTDNFVIIERV